jgi:excisionase family DNA binding protein
MMNQLSSWSSLQIEAQRWRCSVDFLRRKVLRGELPHVRIGNRIRIRPEDVEALLSKKLSRTPR